MNTTTMSAHLSPLELFQQADLIVFTGDLVNVSAEEVIPFQGSLKHIRAHDGIYSVWFGGWGGAF